METTIAVLPVEDRCAHRGNPDDAFDYLSLTIRHYYDSGSYAVLHSPLAILAALLDRLGHFEAAATISGFAATPLTRAGFPEIDATIAHLRSRRWATKPTKPSRAPGEHDQRGDGDLRARPDRPARAQSCVHERIRMNAGDHMNAPSGVVTFLFTDIEGSTRRWEADADAMRTALEAHDACCAKRSRHTRAGCSSTPATGCARCSPRPRAAVDAAVAAQRALELPVRMGIATGEAELREGDYFGAVLNRAARVMAAGHGGQILLDGATAGLLSGVDLIDLGPRRLRDIAKPVADLPGPGPRACAPSFPP